MEHQRHYLWYGKWTGKQPLPEGIREEDLCRCDHAIHVPAAVFEIGVVKKGDGYILLWDNWIGGGLEKYAGKNAGLLKQAYAIASVRKESRKKGYRVTEQRTQTGIRLSLSL